MLLPTLGTSGFVDNILIAALTIIGVSIKLAVVYVANPTFEGIVFAKALTLAHHIGACN